MSKKHNNRNRSQNMTNVINISEEQSGNNNTILVEASKPAPHANGEIVESLEDKDEQPKVCDEQREEIVSSNLSLFERTERLREFLNSIELDEEYSFYNSSKDLLSDIKYRYDSIRALIQKANIMFEKLNSDLSVVITDAKLFEKNFDVLCLFKSPDINEEAKDWFNSLSSALDLMKKAMEGQIDEKLGRVPPSNFRACIKNSSQFDPVYTMSVLTPIYRVKAGSCSEEFFPIASKGANSFSIHSKYLLNTELKLKSVLLTILPESENYKEICNLCSLPIIDGDKDLISYISDLKHKIEEIEESDDKNVEDIESIESFVASFSNRCAEINNVLYESRERVKDILSSVEKQFYKAGMSDLYKLYNDISKLILFFEKTDVAALRNEESMTWHHMLLEIKSKITDYLNRLGIYENETVIENETIWNDRMDFIEIMEGEEDDSKPEGQISKINSIGFYYLLDGEKKVYIEKTKVFVYRKS